MSFPRFDHNGTFSPDDLGGLRADPGRRFYFLDPDGIEYEVVSYR